MLKLLSLVPTISLAVAMLASHPVAAAANAVTVHGTINGGGTALMTSGPGPEGRASAPSAFTPHFIPTAQRAGTSIALTKWETSRLATSLGKLRNGRSVPTD